MATIPPFPVIDFDVWLVPRAQRERPPASARVVGTVSVDLNEAASPASPAPSASTYRLKSVDIEAHQHTGREGSARWLASWLQQGGTYAEFHRIDALDDFEIKIDASPEPVMAGPGDWIIHHAPGRVSVYSEDAFAAAFDAVSAWDHNEVAGRFERMPVSMPPAVASFVGQPARPSPLADAIRTQLKEAVDHEFDVYAAEQLGDRGMPHVRGLLNHYGVPGRPSMLSQRAPEDLVE